MSLTAGAAGVAAIGDQRAVVGEDGDVGRPLGHRELIDRRQLAGVIGEEAAVATRPRPTARSSNRTGARGPSGAACRVSRKPIATRIYCLRPLVGGRSAGSARSSSAAPPGANRGAARSASGFSAPWPNIADPARGVSESPGETRPAGAERKAGGLRAGKACAEIDEAAKILEDSGFASFRALAPAETPWQSPRPRLRGASGVRDTSGFYAMKVTIERSVLLKALGHVHRIVERRNTIPILSNVLIEARDGRLSLKAPISISRLPSRFPPMSPRTARRPFRPM